MAKGNPKSRHNPETSKTPRKAGFDENPGNLRPAWRVGSMEMRDPYGWHEIDVRGVQEIHERLRNFESMMWRDILDRNNHQVSVNLLSKDARDRLTELHLDDLEQLLSLRVTAVKRIWGILEHNVVTLLWWDPEHLVCPSLLKNT